MPDTTKRKLTKLSWPVEIENGALKIPRERMKRDLYQITDNPEAMLILQPVENPKTYRQLRTFHGPIIHQIQDFIMATEGVYKSRDRIKFDLKDQFLQKRKKYWDDGSPMVWKIQHPTKEGVYTEWHVEEVPSLSDLSIDDARCFINAILDFYLHERQLTIVIDPDNADPKFKD